MNFLLKKSIISLTTLFCMTPDVATLAHNPEDTAQPETQVFFMSRVSGVAALARDKLWAAGVGIKFKDSREAPLPYTPESLQDGTLVPLGRFCVTDDATFPPRGYDPLRDVGYSGREGVCGPFAEGTNRRIEFPHNGHTGTKGETRFSYREFFLDTSQGLFYLGVKITSQFTFMLSPIENKDAFKKIANDFILSRKMRATNFYKGLQDHLTADQFARILTNYPMLSEWAPNDIKETL